MCLCCQHHLCSHFQTTISCGRNSSFPSFFLLRNGVRPLRMLMLRNQTQVVQGPPASFFTHKGTVFRILKQQVWYIPHTHPPSCLLERAEQADREPLCHEVLMKSTLHEYFAPFGPLPYWLWLKRISWPAAMPPRKCWRAFLPNSGGLLTQKHKAPLSPQVPTP